MGDKRKLVQDEVVEPEGKKMKKDKKEKKEKKEKRKSRDESEDVSVETPAQDEVKSEKKEKKEKKQEKDRKEKKERKEKKKGTTSADEPAAASEDAMDVDETPAEKEEKKEKKEKKDKKNKKEKKEKKDKKQKIEEKSEEKPAEEPAAEAQAEEEAEEAQQSGKAARFICFVGNLPYSANHESLTKHFEKNPPATIRVATRKEDPKKCRGFAFIEFDNYDRMKTCLKLYHHSNFDDGKYPPRRINVELTAGGGGANSEHRKAKIQAKNEKLNDERSRQAKEIKKDKKKYEKKPAADTSGANAVEVPADDDKWAGVHPSRRGRL